MTRSLATIVTNPDAFFRELPADREELKIPALIVLAGGILGAVSAYLMASVTVKMMSSLMSGIESIAGFGAALWTICFAFLSWLIITGVFYLVSSAFRGEGSFRKCLEVVGYGSVPQMFSALLVAIASFVYLPDITVPSVSGSAASDPQAIQAAMASFMHQAAMVEYTQVTALISIVFLLWSAHIWIYGMKTARSLSMRDAAITVGTPVVLYTLYIVYTMAGI